MQKAGRLLTEDQLPQAEDAALWVIKFLDLKRLAKLGFTQPLDQLDHLSAEAFLLISSEFDRLQDAEIKKKSKKGK